MQVRNEIRLLSVLFYLSCWQSHCPACPSRCRRTQCPSNSSVDEDNLQLAEGGAASLLTRQGRWLVSLDVFIPLLKSSVYSRRNLSSQLEPFCQAASCPNSTPSCTVVCYTQVDVRQTSSFQKYCESSPQSLS